jgi:hypothetical protein
MKQAACLFHPHLSAVIIWHLAFMAFNIGHCLSLAVSPEPACQQAGPLFPAENNEKAEPWTVTS